MVLPHARQKRRTQRLLESVRYIGVGIWRKRAGGGASVDIDMDKTPAAGKAAARRLFISRKCNEQGFPAQPLFPYGSQQRPLSGCIQRQAGVIGILGDIFDIEKNSCTPLA